MRERGSKRHGGASGGTSYPVRLTAFVLLALAALLTVRCSPGAPAATPTPTKTRVAPVLPTNTSMPTYTLQPSATPTPPRAPSPAAIAPSPSPPPTYTPVPIPSEPPTELPPTWTPAPMPTVAPTQQPPPTATTAAQPPLAPQEGGEWDMEAGFVPGSSPLGEDCPGWAIAVGWQAFIAPGTPASSCLNENKNLDNVHSGERSQEITFDFVSAEAGIHRQARAIPGHYYQIEAWGKHIQSESPVELSLGVDLTSGGDWQAATVTWYPWDETAEDTWVHTQATVRATGPSLTIFLKGYHQFAAQGGATLFDDVRVVDLGP
jgi:hypothetical protein